MDRGAWRATVHGVVKSWTQLSTPTRALRVSETLQESRQGNSPALSHQVLTFLEVFTLQSNNDPGCLLSIFSGSASVQSKIYWWS